MCYIYIQDSQVFFIFFTLCFEGTIRRFEKYVYLLELMRRFNTTLMSV